MGTVKAKWLSKDEIEDINEHRRAVGRPEFPILTDIAAEQQRALIDKYAEFGVDPWAGADDDGKDHPLWKV